MYSREERSRLTGEINYMSAFIPGAERYFRRFHEKGGCPLIRACSVITSNTVPVITAKILILTRDYLLTNFFSFLLLF